MVSPELLILDIGAVWRVSRFVTLDTLTERPREALRAAGWTNAGVPRRRAGVAARKLHDLVTCPWCVGVWASLGVVLLSLTGERWWPWVATGLTIAAVSSWLTTRS